MRPHTTLTLAHTDHGEKRDCSGELAEDGAVFSEGDTLGPYRFGRPLHDVQIGRAFLATRLGPSGFEKRVVIRVTESGGAERAVTEASRAATLAHASIAPVLDAGVFGNVGFVASERVAGITLHAVLAAGRSLGWPQAVCLASDVAGALGYMHLRRNEDGELLRLVHRRLAPRRITVDASGRATVTGVGASWAWPDHEGFGSPEEARGEPVDGRADVHSLGLILQRMLAGQERPHELDALVASATAHLPEHRCTAFELQDELERIARHAGATPRSARTRPALPLR